MNNTNGPQAAPRSPQATPATPEALGIQSKVICPSCWTASPPQHLLWVAEHQELLGDSVLGPEAAMRFKPTRFTVDCKALDARGMACTQLACPKCHLSLPRQLVDCPPIFFSIIGVPAAGKSYFLTAMTWQLRGQLPGRFAMSFADADPVANQSLIDYEQTLFCADDPSTIVALRKTELQGELYVSLKFGEHAQILPRPFAFFLKPSESHPNAKAPTAQQHLHKVVCLYDNAGEHFQPGMENSAAPVTQHLGRAAALLFLFDPTQDSRFRSKLGLTSDGTRGGRVQRQETVLHETAARVRRQVGLMDGTRHKRPLIMVLPKLDVWEHLLPESVGPEPLIDDAATAGIDGVDLDRVEHISAVCRKLLALVCPEVIAAAESFCERVTYVPVSAVGTAPVKDPATDLLGFRPADIQPRWVTVPMLYALAKYTKGMIAGPRKADTAPATRVKPAAKAAR